ncbi:hypothetical protein tb265_11110 [Gemmatimonadetes bacterium T265]|nr:hypothetical protein tb265_11110 [Gemmatimonadetes bacterium T265]
MAAIGSQLVVHVRAGYNVANYFSYFTNLSNLVAAAVMLASAARPRAAGPDRARGAAATYLVIVGLVYAALLRGLPLGDLRPWVNAALHVVTPVGVALEWATRPADSRIGAATVVRWLAFPALFLVYTLARGAAVGWYPYPFLNPATAGGYAGVGAYVVGIVGVFALVAWAVAGLANRRARTRQLAAAER